MPILCTVEQSEVNGKLRGLRIIHPDMGLVMDWGHRLPGATVRLVPQGLAFQMMADIERVKTRILHKQARQWELVGNRDAAMLLQASGPGPLPGRTRKPRTRIQEPS